MVTTGDLSNESTTNSGTGFVSLLNAILSTDAGERFSFDDRSEKPDSRVSRRFDSGLWSDGPRTASRIEWHHCISTERCAGQSAFKKSLASKISPAAKTPDSLLRRLMTRCVASTTIGAVMA